MRLELSLTAGLLLAAGVAHADQLSIQLPGGSSAERNTVSYSCGSGRTVKAEYINAGSNSLAIVHYDGQAIVMVSVLSGSGARYAGQQYIWWAKGNSADFYDLTKGEDAPPEFSCEAA